MAIFSASTGYSRAVCSSLPPSPLSGLEDQLLALVVAEERPDLEEAKNQLIVSNAKMREELKEIEDKILQKLSSSEGSPVDDVDLIHTLEQSKAKSAEIKVGTLQITPCITTSFAEICVFGHRGTTPFCRAVTSILSQRLLHKMMNSRAVLIARLHPC